MFSSIYRSTLNTFKNQTGILYDLRYFFTPKCGSPICHVLLTVQNIHRRALFLINNRIFIGFLQTKLGSINRHKPTVTYWSLMKRQALLTIQANLKLVAKTLAKSSHACGKRRKIAAISKYIQPVYCCFMEKLLFFYTCGIQSGVT